MSLAGAKGVERPSEHRLGVLFEISIVCHVLCSWFWRVGWGFSLFWGLFWLVRRVFSGFWGFLCFSFVLLLLVGGGWRVAGGSGARGRRARVSCFLLVGGRVWGASARAWFLSCPVLAVVGSGGRGRVCVLPGSRGGGRVVPGFFCCLLWWGFSGVVFSVRCFSCLLVLRCLVLCWVVVSAGLGVVGGVGLGSGFFSPASAVLARACLGLGWVLFGEFDPGSGRTLAACLTHASRTGPPLWGWVEWRTGEYHVSNLPPAPG